jgi:hypothetical protein
MLQANESTAETAPGAATNSDGFMGGCADAGSPTASTFQHELQQASLSLNARKPTKASELPVSVAGANSAPTSAGRATELERNQTDRRATPTSLKLQGENSTAGTATGEQPKSKDLTSKTSPGAIYAAAIVNAPVPADLSPVVAGGTSSGYATADSGADGGETVAATTAVARPTAGAAMPSAATAAPTPADATTSTSCEAGKPAAETTKASAGQASDLAGTKPLAAATSAVTASVASTIANAAAQAPTLAATAVRTEILTPRASSTLAANRLSGAESTGLITKDREPSSTSIPRDAGEPAAEAASVAANQASDQAGAKPLAAATSTVTASVASTIANAAAHVTASAAASRRVSNEGKDTKQSDRGNAAAQVVHNPSDPEIGLGLRTTLGARSIDSGRTAAAVQPAAGNDAAANGGTSKGFQGGAGSASPHGEKGRNADSGVANKPDAGPKGTGAGSPAFGQVAARHDATGAANPNPNPPPSISNGSPTVANASPTAHGHADGAGPSISRPIDSAAVVAQRDAGVPGASGVPVSGLDPAISAMHDARLVTKANQAEMRIQLEADGLGPVELRASVVGNTIGATIAAQRPETHWLLSSGVGSLHQALSDQHLHVDRIDILWSPGANVGGGSGGAATNGSGAEARQQGAGQPWTGTASAPAPADSAAEEMTTTSSMSSLYSEGKLSVRV